MRMPFPLIIVSPVSAVFSRCVCSCPTNITKVVSSTARLYSILNFFVDFDTNLLVVKFTCLVCILCFEPADLMDRISALSGSFLSPVTS